MAFLALGKINNLSDATLQHKQTAQHLKRTLKEAVFWGFKSLNTLVFVHSIIVKDARTRSLVLVVPGNFAERWHYRFVQLNVPLAGNLEEELRLH